MAHGERVGLGMQVGAALELARLLLGVERLAECVRDLVEVSRERGGGALRGTGHPAIPACAPRERGISLGAAGIASIMAYRTKWTRQRARARICVTQATGGAFRQKIGNAF